MERIRPFFFSVAHMKDAVLLAFLLAGCHRDFSAFPGEEENFGCLPIPSRFIHWALPKH